MKIDNRQQILLILTLGLLALWVGDLVVIEPLIKWGKSRQSQIAELRQEVKQGKSLIRRETVIRNEWDHIRSNALANDSSQAEQQVLKAFSNWAGDSGVNVNSITPQWQNDQEDYSTLDCRVEASGTLETLSRFLYEIENDPMPLQLETVSLTSSDDKGQSLNLALQISGLALVPQSQK